MRFLSGPSLVALLILSATTASHAAVLPRASLATSPQHVLSVSYDDHMAVTPKPVNRPHASSPSKTRRPPFVLETSPELDTRFSGRDLTVILNWTRDHRHNAGHGSNQGLTNLPSSLVHKLQERASLPHGLRTKGLPEDVLGQLKPLPRSYRYTVIGHDVAIVHVPSGRVADVIRGVL